MTTKYDTEMIQIMALFERVTKSKLKDCFYYRERLTFVTEPGELKKALGKNNVNVEKLEKLTAKKVKIAEFSTDKLTFIRNVLYPLRVVSMEEEEEVVVIKGPDAKTKGLMIGAKAKNLRRLEEVVQKYFPLKEIKVM
ncbi:MAG: NusA-like transcription termination signal-binding factor [Candidatus Woesearchaeota archaeon]|nr:MAG: NusA-like transcription termination signal-binding factor [Candidatus Woesearchaeota archaeon]